MSQQSILEATARVMATIPASRYKLRNRFICDKTGAQLWNADAESVAAWCECDPEDVEFHEDDDGAEYVTVLGQRAGALERM